MVHAMYCRCRYWSSERCIFFFQAEDGIRDYKVTGVQTCALPILCCGGLTYFGVSKGLGAAGEQLKKQVADNADVKEQLGEIESISMNLMETGQEKQKHNDNSNWLVFDAKGSEGDGKFIAEMPPGGSNGSPFGKIELRTEDGKTFQIK